MNIKKFPWVFRALFYKLFTKVGMPSYIGKPLFISRISGLKLGRKVRIYPGMRAEIETPNGSISIGDNTSIGQNAHIVSYDDNLKIGRNVTISGNVFISNCSHSYQAIDEHILEQPIVSAVTEIGDNCFIGYGAIIQAGTILGKHVVVGSNSVVKGKFPDYCVVVGSPARIIKMYNFEKSEWERI